MEKYQFINFIPAEEGEKHLGIATIKRIEQRDILRFKIIRNKDGVGFFPTMASYKIKDPNTGEERYIPAYSSDSISEKEELEHFIKTHVKACLNPAPQKNNQQQIVYPSTFQPRAPSPKDEEPLPF